MISVKISPSCVQSYPIPEELWTKSHVPKIFSEINNSDNIIFKQHLNVSL